MSEMMNVLTGFGVTKDHSMAQAGVRGMKWGVRKDRSSGSSSKGGKPSATEDAVRAAVLKKQARKHGVSTLNNDQLKELNKRLNLEQQYSQWAKNNPTMAQRATGFVAKELKENGINRVSTLAGRDKDKLVAGLLREAVSGKPANGQRKSQDKPVYKPPAVPYKPKRRLGD